MTRTAVIQSLDHHLWILHIITWTKLCPYNVRATNNALWIWMLGGQQSRCAANRCTGWVVAVTNH